MHLTVFAPSNTVSAPGWRSSSVVSVPAKPPRMASVALLVKVQVHDGAETVPAAIQTSHRLSISPIVAKKFVTDIALSQLNPSPSSATAGLRK